MNRHISRTLKNQLVLMQHFQTDQHFFQLNSVLETGLSDFHLLTVTEFKMGFTKSKPRIITYWNYKKFNNNAFRSEIQSLWPSEFRDLGFSKDSIFHIFNKYAPIKKVLLRK